MPHKFTSLRHPTEKLLEAEHFLARMVISDDMEFQFELNAFLSASRSVTFVLQKSMLDVPGFACWYQPWQTSMKADKAMRFFLDLRNISQKEGPVSFIGAFLQGGGWTYRFVSLRNIVPDELEGRDICTCCAAHLVKLGNLLIDCFKAFPFHCCPGRTFTEKGMVTLGYTFEDVEKYLGLPSDYLNVGDFPAADKLRAVSREIEPLDVASIERIAEGDIRAGDTSLEFLETSGVDLIDEIAAVVVPSTDESKQRYRDPVLRAIAKRIEQSRPLQ